MTLNRQQAEALKFIKARRNLNEMNIDGRQQRRLIRSLIHTGHILRIGRCPNYQYALRKVTARVDR